MLQSDLINPEIQDEQRAISILRDLSMLSMWSLFPNVLIGCFPRFNFSSKPTPYPR